MSRHKDGAIHYTSESLRPCVWPQIRRLGRHLEHDGLVGLDALGQLLGEVGAVGPGPQVAHGLGAIEQADIAGPYDDVTAG